MQVKLTVTIITYNEEHNIENCLESVKNIADEIIVVDSFSTDNTENIAKKYKVRFIKNKFEGHIEQKNFAIQQAKYNHVLSLDADEILSKQLFDEIVKVKNNWEFDAYYFNRLTNFCGKWIKHSGWYPDKKLRLWDTTKGEWGGVNPHDCVICKANTTKQYLKGDLLHYSFSTIYQHIEQINKFSEIKAVGLHKKGKKTNIFQIIFSPILKFLKSYFLQFGFLDGFYGFVIAINSAHSNFLKYTKLKAKSKTYKKCNSKLQFGET